jgi:hypothetical protein
MMGACRGGQRETAEWLVNDNKHLVDDSDWDYYLNWALYSACEGGHRELAEWLTDVKGANDFNKALWGACCGGHRELAEWLIDVKGADNWNMALTGACEEDNTKEMTIVFSTYSNVH